MLKPVSLTVHRNTRDQRAAKTLRSNLREDAKAAVSMPGLAGYAIVAWDSALGHRCFWSMPGGIMTANVLPEYAAGAFRRSINNADRFEDGE